MKKVLIVDDEKDVLEAVVAGLADDFMVLAVSNSKEALEKLNQDQDIAAIIADKDKPRIENSQELEEVGLELLETVRKRYPAVKRVLMSGRSPILPMDGKLVEAFWPKPFLPSQSIRWLGEILDQPSS